LTFFLTGKGSKTEYYKLVVLICFILLFLSQLLNAQQKSADWKYRINHLTTEDGLSQNTIDCILKDSRGFMWFGTWNGLNRYDGYNFMVYKKESNSNSISSNFIHAIAEDHTGNLWIATRNGLNLFDFKQDKFIRFFHDTLSANYPGGNWINTVYSDREGTIWAGMNTGGLDKITPSGDVDQYNFTHFRHDSADKYSISSNDIRVILEDSHDQLWVGTAKGLNLMDRKNGRFRLFTSEQENDSNLSIAEIRCIHEDHEGAIWIGTTQGLYLWDLKSEKLDHFTRDPDDPGSLSHSVITDIAEDLQHNIYIGTLGGVDIIHKGDKSFSHIPVKIKADQSLNNEFINSIYCDPSGLIWIGTDKGGINKFNVRQKEFRYIAHNPDDPNSLSNNTVNSVMDEPGYLWIGTAGGGLNLFDKKRRVMKYYLNDPHREDLISSNFITSILRDSDGALWIGTWGMGFDKMIDHTGDGVFVHHRNTTGNPQSLINDFISTLYEDKEGNFWIGTEGGLDLFLKESGIFKHINNHPAGSTLISEVGCILRDFSGNLWIGTRNGLFYIASEYMNELIKSGYSDKIVCLKNDPADSGSINENYVISLFQNKQGTIWVGTFGNGLNKLLTEGVVNGEARFKHYDQTDGLCNNVIYGILEDENQTLWLSTDFGLSRFVPKDESFRNYYVTDGLRSNQFYWSACTRGVDGYLYFGGMNGLNYFHPDEIFDNTQLPRAVITDFKIYNQSVKVGSGLNKHVVLKQVISESKKIKLNYKENTFSFEFSALSYDLPDKNKYKYKMEGVDLDWIEVSADRRFANYTKLKGGEYVFRVKAANNDGIWNEEPLSLSIAISPPFWLSLWFKILLIVILVSSIYIYLKLHTRSLRIQKNRLEEQVSERTAKIEQQKQELLHQAEILQEKNDQLARRQDLIENQKIQMEKQNIEIIGQRDKLILLNKKVKTVNQLKLKFFTNISHEFKTPLTLILGPLEKLIRGWKTEDDTWQMLNLINRNAERLMHLINQLMDFRKVEKGRMALHVTRGDAAEFIENIIISFQELALQRSVSLSTNGPANSSEVWFDHEKMENILYNLLSNAFKYTPVNGRIWTSLKFYQKEPDSTDGYEITGTEQPQWMRIEVGDTGVGIAEDKLSLIFKRFYRVENNNANIQGSGIGLALTKELVKTHHGTIAVESSPGKGSVFQVNLPCSHEQFSNQETSEQLYQTNSLDRKVNLLKYELLSHTHKVRGLPATQMAQHKNSPLILIAEDNNDLREFIVTSVDKTYNVIDTDNGKSAYELAVQFNPEIIISDIMMPQMDGIELCTKIKENLATSHIPVLLLTSKGAVESRIEGYKAGADEYIAKPFSLELLETRIINLIESRKKLREIFNASLRPDPEIIASNPTDQKFLNKAILIVESNMENSEFGVTEFAGSMSVSRTLLHKKLTALTSQSASDFINAIRLKRSQELIVSGEYNISEVAYAVGYNDPKYYSRIFRKYFGISPSDFMKEKRVKAS
jgi:signal transduction histidine kinase/ligand-binding sensor domain-containing protein/DNA-binding response OmpR family regulator